MSWAAQAWAEANTPDEIPEPAPVRLSIAQGPACVDWCIGSTHTRETYAYGSACDLASATQAAQEAAQRLGLVERPDGWTSPPLSRGYVPGPSA